VLICYSIRNGLPGEPALCQYAEALRVAIVTAGPCCWSAHRNFNFSQQTRINHLINSVNCLTGIGNVSAPIQNDDPATRTWKMTQMTRWPNDPVPCLVHPGSQPRARRCRKEVRKHEQSPSTRVECISGESMGEGRWGRSPPPPKRARKIFLDVSENKSDDRKLFFYILVFTKTLLTSHRMH